MLRLNDIIGYVTDPELGERLHRLGHEGRIEYLVLSQQDTRRHRLRMTTDQGSDCAVALDRSVHLGDGAILLLDKDRAIVVRMQAERWLTLAPADIAAALELGYNAGNLHWRVRFTGEHIQVSLQGPEEAYLERLAPLMSGGRVAKVEDD